MKKFLIHEYEVELPIYLHCIRLVLQASVRMRARSVEIATQRRPHYVHTS